MPNNQKANKQTKKEEKKKERIIKNWLNINYCVK